MELLNNFRIDVPIDKAWATLTDIEGIAPCMPGAQLTSVDDDVFSGTVKVKVGPITATYRGKASFAEKDDANYRAVIDASGRDTRGAGNANAMITLHLTPDGDGTSAAISTDLKVTGKVAQFGRGVMADISEKLLGQFVECLETKLAEGESGEVEFAEEESDDATERRIDMPEAKPVDLLDAAGAPILKRAAPMLLLLFVLFLLRRRRQ